MSGGFSIRQQAGSVVVALKGEIDLQNSPALRLALLDQLSEHRDVVVDLGGVDYIDSSGIACFVEAYQMARSQGMRFCLAAVSAQAMRVLKLARLDEIFVIFDRVDQAVAGA